MMKLYNLRKGRRDGAEIRESKEDYEDRGRVRKYISRLLLNFMF